MRRLSGILRVAARFFLRLALLATFASASRQPFWVVSTSLLAAATGLCVVMAFARREPLFGADLNHWDEAAAYALLGRGIAIAVAAAPPEAG